MRPFAAYLQQADSYRHYFIWTGMVVSGAAKVAAVWTAWGPTNVVNNSKQYLGPAGRAFTDERHAQLYARKIAIARADEGFTVQWSTDASVEWPRLAESYPVSYQAHANGGRSSDFYGGETPRAFLDAVEAAKLTTTTTTTTRAAPLSGIVPNVPETQAQKMARLRAKAKQQQPTAGKEDTSGKKQPKRRGKFRVIDR